MSRTAQILVFLGVATVVFGGLHYYVYVRLVRDLALTGGVRVAATALISGLFALLVLAMPVARVLPRHYASPLAWAAFIWMGTLGLLTLALVTGDIIHLLLRPVIYPGAPGPPDPERRVLIRRLFAFATLGATGLLAGVSLWSALRRVAVRELQVTLPRLPRALSGLRIVQLTDLHIGPTIDGDWLKQVVAQVNALAPDVVAITGDLVDGRVEELAHHVAPLAGLRARHGVFFVTGNHEYYSGADPWIATLTDLGVRVLRNERVTLRAGAGGAPIDLAGVDDFHSHHFPGHGPDLRRALAGRDLKRPVVLLAHQPAAIEEAAAHGVDLQLSGHTHGGQLWPWRYLVRLQQPYVAGLHRHPGTDTQIYVSSGTGYWGPPMRLGAPAEITHITLLAPA